jgi:ankyrin repeat protein
MRFAILLLTMAWLPASIPAKANTAAEMFSRALAAGNLKVLDTLLSSGVSPDTPDAHGQTPLYIAISSNGIGAVDLLLKWNADPNAHLTRGRDNGQYPITPLQYAAQKGDLRIAGRLIDAGAQINATGIAGRTPLHFAGGRQLSMMQLLIEKGADVNARDAEGASPLDDAVWNGSLDAVAILLAHGARLNEPDTHTGATPLNEAAFRGHAQVIQYLLQFHPDLNIRDKQGFLPLQNAVRMGKEESALLLLEAEPGNALVESTLAAAIRKDEALVVEAMVRRGASPNDPLGSGATPLDQACSDGAIKTARVLLDQHADPNNAGRNGSTPLEDAALKGFDAIAALLLEHGARIDQVNAGSGTTALYAAASFGRDTTVKLLLDHGANAGLCGRSNKTPYQAALANGYGGLAAQILKSGGAKSCK